MQEHNEQVNNENQNDQVDERNLYNNPFFNPNIEFFRVQEKILDATEDEDRDEDYYESNSEMKKIEGFYCL